jgi:hypothetical protein
MPETMVIKVGVSAWFSSIYRIVILREYLEKKTAPR